MFVPGRGGSIERDGGDGAGVCLFQEGDGGDRASVCLFQEEEALLNEMEVTGQAFEDMQEQNIRLLLQLREKDDANFKLMSEVSPVSRPCCTWFHMCSLLMSTV